MENNLSGSENFDKDFRISIRVLCKKEEDGLILPEIFLR
jgi:hypothetical protein